MPRLALFAAGLLSAACAASFASEPSAAKTPQSAIRSKLVVVVANRICLADLDNPALPTISKLLREGAVGLVSPNCIGPKSEYSVLLTACAGASCRGDSYVSECFGVDETVAGQTAGEAYALRTGYRAPPGSAVFLGLPQALRECVEIGSPAALGACGEAVRAAGGKTCATGNADRPPDWFDRSAAVLAMDSRGQIDVGLLGPSLTRPIRLNTLVSVAGRTAWYRHIPTAWCAIERADYVVIYFDDTVRLDETRISIADTAFEVHKAKALQALDALIWHTMRRAGPRATIMLISFSPPSDGLWDQLTPVVVFPAKPGLLTSPTTRTAGLIAASDYAPTVLDLLDVTPTVSMVGRPAYSKCHPRHLRALYDMETRVATNRVLTVPVLWVFALVGAVSFTSTGATAAFRLAPPRRVMILLRTGLLVVACAPLAMLLAVLWPPGVEGYALGTLSALALVIAASAMLSRLFSAKAAPPGGFVLAAFALTTAVLFVDTLTGGSLCRFALPSCYHLSGMRYYGVGNEYSGAFISMGALLAALWPCRRRKVLVAVLGVATVALLGIGSLGANYGATIVAAITFGLVYLAVLRGGFGARHVAQLFVFAVAVVIALAYADWKLAGAAGSHGGQATGLADKLGRDYVLSLASRKSLLNIGIIASGTAQKAFLVFLPLAALWFYRVGGTVRNVYSAEPRVLASLKAVAIGAVFAFLLNDSGLVFAGIMLSMSAAYLLYGILEEPVCQG